MIGTSDLPCWQAEACESLLRFLVTRNISHCFRPLLALGTCSAEILANNSAESCTFELL